MAAGGLVALWGGDHPTLDELAVDALGERAGVALTRGRFPKPYPHLDPNEDAVLAAAGERGWLLAVADGHSGFDAARAALEAVAEQAPALLDGDGDPTAALEDLCEAAIAAVTRTVASAEQSRQASRTALTVALATSRHLYVATFGDTVCVRVRGRRAKTVGAPTAFLGPDSDVAGVQRLRLRPGDAVTVASDGLSDYLGRGWPQRIAALTLDTADPAAAARLLVEEAMAGGAGDNVAVAVLRC